MTNQIFLMCGSNKPFEDAGYQFPKNLVDVGGRPMAEVVLRNAESMGLSDARTICLIPRSEDRRYHTGQMLKLIKPDTVVVEVNEPTGGALCTALLACEYMEADQPLVIVNGDILVDFPLREAVAGFRDRGLDGGIIVINDFHPRWSFVKVGPDGLAIEVAEKRPISNLATVGIYYFAKGSDFTNAAYQMLMKDAQEEGTFYLAPVYNELILAGKKIGHHLVPKNRYFSLKTPQDVHAYEKYLEHNN